MPPKVRLIAPGSSAAKPFDTYADHFKSQLFGPAQLPL